MTKKGATGDFFFSKIGQYFPTPEKKNGKKKKRNAAALLTIILATRWTGNSLFFNGQPNTNNVNLIDGNVCAHVLF